MEPFLKWQIISEATETGHGCVGVQINQARHYETAISIQLFFGFDLFRQIRGLSYSDNAIAGNSHSTIFQDLLAFIKSQNKVTGDEQIGLNFSHLIASHSAFFISH